MGALDANNRRPYVRRNEPAPGMRFTAWHRREYGMCARTLGWDLNLPSAPQGPYRDVCLSVPGGCASKTTLS